MMAKLKYKDGNEWKQIAPSKEEFDSHLADYASFKTNTNQSIEDIEKELDNYSSFASGKDDNGIFTIVEYKDTGDILYMTSTLTNPDTDSNYQTMTWEFTNGDILVWNITYDEDGDIVSKVVST